MPKFCDRRGCRASPDYPNSAPSLKSSTYKLLDRPHLDNTVDIQVTPLEMTILIASLVVFVLMFIWVIIVAVDCSFKIFRRKLFKGQYTFVEGRRYRQDMMRGGDHLEHRMIRRSIVERLARFGMVKGVPSKNQKMEDVEATGMGTEVLVASVECDGKCQNGVTMRRRSAEQ